MSALRHSWVGIAALAVLAAAALLAGRQSVGQQGPAAPTAPAATEAEAAAPVQPDSDPPRRSMRLGYIEGSVSLRPAGLDDWNAAPLNQPLTIGDSLWTDSGSRAEVDLGPAVARLDERTGIAVLDLSDGALQLRLDAGTLDVEVNSVDDWVTFEIDAPNAAIVLVREGEYRIGVDDDGNTSIAVRAGLAQIQGGDRQITSLATGQRALFGSNGSYALAQVLPPDDFDRWCQQRQSLWAEDQSVAQYVPPEVVGYEDLHDYGQWQQEPDYGSVWFPTQVSDDWAPYSVGHWAWVTPWGWTWIDEAPWGFAPFHYGRWGRFGRRWGWVPPPRWRHALYAPALVAWVGGPGAGGALALGGGAAIGWLPLAPGEVYLPAYRASLRYVQDVNLSNSASLSATAVSNVAREPARQNRYANRSVPNALTVVPQVSFVAGQAVVPHRIAPPPQFEAASPSARAPGIAPGRESLLGAYSLERIARPPASIADRAVVTHRQPPAPWPSFELQQPAIVGNGGLPLDRTQMRALSAPTVRLPAAASGEARTAMPEHAPRVQPPPALGPNVFRQRDQELQQQHEAELRAKPVSRPQEVPSSQDAQTREQQLRLQEQLRFQEQQRLQEQQHAAEQQRLEQQRLQYAQQPNPQPGEPPRDGQPPAAVAAPPHPTTDVRHAGPPPEPQR